MRTQRWQARPAPVQPPEGIGPKHNRVFARSSVPSAGQIHNTALEHVGPMYSHRAVGAWPREHAVHAQQATGDGGRRCRRWQRCRSPSRREPLPQREVLPSPRRHILGSLAPIPVLSSVPRRMTSCGEAGARERAHRSHKKSTETSVRSGAEVAPRWEKASPKTNPSFRPSRRQ